MMLLPQVALKPSEFKPIEAIFLCEEPEAELQARTDRHINQGKEYSHEGCHHHNHRRGQNDLATCWPCDFRPFAAHFLNELKRICAFCCHDAALYAVATCDERDICYGEALGKTRTREDFVKREAATPRSLGLFQVSRHP